LGRNEGTKGSPLPIIANYSPGILMDLPGGPEV